MSTEEVFPVLPVMPVSDAVNWSNVEVSGLVDSPQSLSLADMEEMARAETVLDFLCYDGWTAPAQRWEGVPVSAVLDRVGTSADAKFVKFSCGEFARAMSLDEARADDTLLALGLNGEALPAGNGGPCRLVAANHKGPAHVKWVQSIEVLSEDPTA